jgi:hypothetical protein
MDEPTGFPPLGAGTIGTWSLGGVVSCFPALGSLPQTGDHHHRSAFYLPQKENLQKDSGDASPLN